MIKRCEICQHVIKTSENGLDEVLRCMKCGHLLQLSKVRTERKSGEVGLHPALALKYKNLDEEEITQTQISLPPTDKEEEKKSKEIKVATHIIKNLNDRHETVIVEDPKPFRVGLPKVPGYEIIKIVGQGAMGQVFKATHNVSHREVAVKILASKLIGRKDLVARFERETAALRTFRHPNVVAILEAGSHNGLHYFCMEFIKGTTLRKYINNGPVEISKAVEYTRAILRGLSAAHSRGVIHRDLKPENVLIELAVDFNTGKEIERPVLVDFGLANIDGGVDPHPNLTKSKVTMGTVNYMAPEQHTDAKYVDHRSDLYACGVMFYELITGDLPIGRYFLPKERDIKVPESVDKCILKSLARSPGNRFQSASEFDTVLAQIEKDLETFEVSEKKPPQQSLENQEFEDRFRNEKRQALRARFFFNLSKQLQLKLALSLCFLLVGIGISIFFAFDAPGEVIVSGDLVAAVSGKSDFLAPPFEQPQSNESMQELVKWRSNSPLWQKEQGKIIYLAKQGRAKYFRNSFSLVVADKAQNDRSVEVSLQVEMTKPEQTTSYYSALQRAKKKLGGSIGQAGSGVFYVNESNGLAVGSVVFIDSSCGLALLKKKGKSFAVRKVVKGECPAYMLSADGFDLELRCNKNTGLCEMFSAGKLLSAARFEAIKKQNRWDIALGCSNLNCSFARKES